MKTPASNAALSQRSLLAAPDSGAASQRTLAADAAPSASAQKVNAAAKTSPYNASKTPAKRKKNAPDSDAPDANDDDETESANDDAKKRVRLKPETREQLLERLRNPALSLHETSIILRVSRATVRRYADAGRLPCLRTPGGQRRFALRDIENFYRHLKTRR